jgi:hypothetical protein
LVGTVRRLCGLLCALQFVNFVFFSCPSGAVREAPLQKLCREGIIAANAPEANS